MPPRARPAAARFACWSERVAWTVLLMPLLTACEGLIYFPQPLSEREAQSLRVRHPQAEEVRITTPDGTALHGWVARAAGPAPRGRVIYFGGNAEEVSWMLDHREVFAGWDLVLVNYRGYGLSGGRPSERSLFADALTVHDHLARVQAAGDVPVVALGRSLGSGVAVHLASRRPLAAVILVTPFDSIAAVAGDAFPFLPARLLVGDLYDSLALAPSLRVPLGMIVAGRDEVIPGERSLRLFEAWGGPKELVTIPGAGHNDMQLYPGYWGAIRGFLARLGAPVGDREPGTR